jgi:DNA-binding transcriptional regulator YhcF (GntR family)
VPTEPPYLRIAADVRRLIMSGDLTPGDLVPSTRQITTEYGVAMATATKALSWLKQEGLVRVMPGVGTVVADSAAARSAAPEGVSKETVVTTALRIADLEGLAAVSMRRVATELSVSTMALHRHVPGRAELLRLMSDAVFGEDPPGTPGRGWRAGLEQAARWQWKLYGRHPWLVQTVGSFTRPILAVNGMKHTERVMKALSGLGLTKLEMMQIHMSMLGYVQGIAMANEFESQARQDTGMTSEEWMALQDSRMETIQAGRELPVLNTMFTQNNLDIDLDRLFEFGLTRVLDGIGVLIEQRAAGRA